MSHNGKDATNLHLVYSGPDGRKCYRPSVKSSFRIPNEEEAQDSAHNATMNTLVECLGETIADFVRRAVEKHIKGVTLANLVDRNDRSTGCRFRRCIRKYIAELLLNVSDARSSIHIGNANAIELTLNRVRTAATVESLHAELLRFNDYVLIDPRAADRVVIPDGSSVQSLRAKAIEPAAHFQLRSIAAYVQLNQRFLFGRDHVYLAGCRFGPSHCLLDIVKLIPGEAGAMVA